MLNHNVPQRVNILNKTVVDTLLEKELLVASNDNSNIKVIEKTSSQGDKDLVDFEATKRDLLFGGNSPKMSNISPVICTNTSVIQKHDVNTSSEIRLSSKQVLERGLGFASFQRKVNEPKLRRNFEES